MLTETAINISISNKSPSTYMAETDTQIKSGVPRNLAENAVPIQLSTVDASSYKEFPVERRKLMAATIRDYYQAL